MMSNRRRIVVAALVCTSLAVVVSAFAVASSGAKAIVSSSVGPVSSSRAGGLDAASRTHIEALNGRGVGDAVLGQRLIAEARTLPTRVDGWQLYLVPTKKGKLSFGLGSSLEEWFDPLSQTHPVLFAATDDDGPGGVGATVYGVAIDGVTSILLTIGGAQKTVPVSGNVFVFHGDPAADFSSIAPISATFADGTVQALR